jgi:NAD(P)-dependent dehydrogenase (short-subunit alcohol dehydrogenase family)
MVTSPSAKDEPMYRLSQRLHDKVRHSILITGSARSGTSIYGVVAPKFGIYEGTNMTKPVEYAAIKSALIHLSRYISTYISDTRFRINCVSPGGIFDNQAEPFLERYTAHTRGQGMLDTGDVLGAMLFLVSDMSIHITGQNLVVDDGFTL